MNAQTFGQLAIMVAFVSLTSAMILSLPSPRSIDKYWRMW